jgi:hypothetical protein
MKTKILYIILFAFISCKNENVVIDKNDITYLESEYQKSKADSTFNRLVQAYGKAVINSKDKKVKQEFLQKAITLCEGPEKAPLKEVFFIELLKVNPDHTKAADFIFELAESMELRNKKEAASLLYSGFAHRFPSDPRSKDISGKILKEQSNHDTYFKNLAKNVLTNPGERGVNADNTELFIDLCESFAIAYPNEKMSPVYLFKAADMARALGSLPKMLSLYDWVFQYYPTFDKAPLALFLKGFALDSELRKFDEAKEVYQEFLVKFPQDSLAKDVNYLLENLGKSPDQMFKEMQMENQ